MGWTSCPPLAQGGQDVYPTKLDNLFVGNPLSAATGEIECRDVAVLRLYKGSG
ncbi:hypothetical protein [Nostoc sp. JL33]|uniref:hypothetical protein n=1 Tax=Nostoc sp. JL33 TaxID=2815396 RepID=UPI0025E99179|nr:hypothetical protein [Nostoc sp. JL33]MBN3871801.1 hypothetical protein [Nostoc sp. JL33]